MHITDAELGETLSEVLSGKPTSETDLVEMMQRFRQAQGEERLSQSPALTKQLYFLLMRMKDQGVVSLSHGCRERRCWCWANTPQQHLKSEPRALA